MNEKKTEKKITASNCEKNVGKEHKNKWQKPAFEDVSGRVMAQPYIRFT